MKLGQAGLTIAELLIGIIIVGVMAMIAIPKFNRSQVNLTISNQNLLADIRMARANSVGRSAHYRVTLSTTSYQVARLNLVGSTWTVASSTTVNFPANISVTVGAGSAIEFTTRGMLVDKPDGRLADPISVTLSDAKYGLTKQFTIWASGQVVEA